MSTSMAGLLAQLARRHQRVLVMALVGVVQTRERMMPRPRDDPHESGHHSPPGSVPTS